MAVSEGVFDLKYDWGYNTGTAAQISVSDKLGNPNFISSMDGWMDEWWMTDQSEEMSSSLATFLNNTGGLVICELRTGELVICELIERTTDANLGYNANHKVRTFYAIKRGPYTCLCIRNAEMTFITIQNADRNSVYMLQKYHKTTRVRWRGNYLHYTGPTVYVYA